MRKWFYGDGGGWSVQSSLTTAGQALAGEGERKHDGEDGEDKRQYKEKGDAGV